MRDDLNEVMQQAMVVSRLLRQALEANADLIDAMCLAVANGATREDIIDALKAGSETGDIPAFGQPSPEFGIRSFLSNMAN